MKESAPVLPTFPEYIAPAGDYLQRLFLDWFNNYLTLERFAEDHGIDTTTAAVLINHGRAIHESRV